MHYIVILSGGTGPRLWPLSRVEKPKQFLTLFSKNSLLKETLLRAKKLVPLKNIFIVTNYKYTNLIKKDLGKSFPHQNILSEPQKKNTAMALLYASAVISQQDPNAVITSFPSDHYIGNLDKFIKNINRGVATSLNDKIVVYGVKPTLPNPAYGYIVTDAKLKVKKFIEKPSIAVAQNLINQGHTFWNSGIYTFKVSHLLSEFKKHQPEYLPLYDQIYNHPQNSKVIQKIYSLSPALALDVAISEKSKNLHLIPTTFAWSDIGEWSAIRRQIAGKKNQVVALTPTQKMVEINSKNCLVHSSTQKVVGLVNLEDIAIIDTPDALLVCNLKEGGSYQVKDLITKLVSQPKLKSFFTGKHD